MYTASFAFFEALWEAGVTHVFVNLGSDHPSILEAIVKGQRETPDAFPKIVTCPNEMVALSAAHGMALVTGQPQAVLVHVDVGTQGLGAAVHNASCGRVPVFIFAGLSPFTQEGEMRGSRTEFIHWIQDIPDQGQIVRQYCRYDNEVRTGKNIKQLVNRSMQFAQSDPKGPVYLTAAREVLEEDLTPYHLNQEVWHPIEPCALPPHAASEIAEALYNAKCPLVITGYVGREHAAVHELVKLATKVPIRVLDTTAGDMCFPHDHPGCLGVAYGVHPMIPKADVILVIDCDVPWIPTACNPSKDAKIFHLDVDPLKQQMPVFYINAQHRYKTNATLALTQINATLESKSAAPHHADLRKELEAAHKEWREDIIKKAAPPSDGSLTTNFVVAELRKLVPDDTVFCTEPVTETVNVINNLNLTLPGTLHNSGSGGLGWYGGAAVGVKLALDQQKAKGENNGSGFVCAIVGDGTFLFSVPSSVYWMSRRYDAPFLTIVLNNSGWNAPKRSALLVHPDGLASKATKQELCIDFEPSPDYAGIARAASGNTIWAGKASTAEELAKLLPEAVEFVKGGKGAVLEVRVGALF
ncbi:thiamine diphosphate-binding protein [Ascobolus immersus RN42]|uniref:Thiamine diphosphate-binding protein n=1 Tax=Ascobolus immersus RN42 TaxID=1160509 RepID=A0A3N4IJ16_ASCIM|nr:thiamine diphosphate-binding protein [Ascobolus immersus RN42]